MTLFIKLVLSYAFLFQCQVFATPGIDDLVIVSSYNKTHTKDDGCRFLLESFAYASANFTFCAISNARPITLCQGCVQSYTLSTKVHKDILKLMDEAGELCKEKLLNLDRLQVVEGGFGFISGLWKRAACDLCYELDSEGNPEKLTKNVKEIIAFHNQTHKCIQDHVNDTDEGRITDPSVCDECKSVYLQLNSQYNHFKDETPFCMDIIDMMNSTRLLWSVSLGCCLDRQKSESMFLLMSGLISVLPVVFYLIACRFTGKKEHVVATRNHYTIPYPDNTSPIPGEPAGEVADDAAKQE